MMIGRTVQDCLNIHTNIICFAFELVTHTRTHARTHASLRKSLESNVGLLYSRAWSNGMNGVINGVQETGQNNAGIQGYTSGHREWDFVVLSQDL